MKKFLFLFLAILPICVLAQNLSYESKPYGHGYHINVIQPTIDNFIKLCDMNASQFISAMKYYDYFEMDNSSYECIDYWNGSIDNFAFAKAVNSFSRTINGWIIYMGDKEYMFPNDSFSDFLSQLSPYYYEQTDRIYNNRMSDVYTINRNGFVYGIFVTNMGKSWDVHAFRFAE